MSSGLPPSSSWLWSNLDGVVAAVAFVTAVAHAALSYFWPSRKEIDKRFMNQDRRVESVEDEAARAHGRLDVIDQGMKSLATKEDIAKIMAALARQDGDRRELGERVAGVQAVMERIERPLDVIMQAALQGPLHGGRAG